MMGIDGIINDIRADLVQINQLKNSISSTVKDINRSLLESAVQIVNPVTGVVENLSVDTINQAAIIEGNINRIERMIEQHTTLFNKIEAAQFLWGNAINSSQKQGGSELGLTSLNKTAKFWRLGVNSLFRPDNDSRYLVIETIEIRYNRNNPSAASIIRTGHYYINEPLDFLGQFSIIVRFALNSHTYIWAPDRSLGLIHNWTIAEDLPNQSVVPNFPQEITATRGTDIDMAPYATLDDWVPTLNTVRPEITNYTEYGWRLIFGSNYESYLRTTYSTTDNTESWATMDMFDNIKKTGSTSKLLQIQEVIGVSSLQVLTVDYLYLDKSNTPIWNGLYSTLFPILGTGTRWEFNQASFSLGNPINQETFIVTPLGNGQFTYEVSGSALSGPDFLSGTYKYQSGDTQAVITGNLYTSTSITNLNRAARLNGSNAYTAVNSKNKTFFGGFESSINPSPGPTTKFYANLATTVQYDKSLFPCFDKRPVAPISNEEWGIPWGNIAPIFGGPWEPYTRGDTVLSYSYSRQGKVELPFVDVIADSAISGNATFTILPAHIEQSIFTLPGLFSIHEKEIDEDTIIFIQYLYRNARYTNGSSTSLLGYPNTRCLLGDTKTTAVDYHDALPQNFQGTARSLVSKLFTEDGQFLFNGYPLPNIKMGSPITMSRDASKVYIFFQRDAENNLPYQGSRLDWEIGRFLPPSLFTPGGVVDTDGVPSSLNPIRAWLNRAQGLCEIEGPTNVTNMAVVKNNSLDSGTLILDIANTLPGIPFNIGWPAGDQTSWRDLVDA